jgi:hypothetical protein
VLSLLPIRGLQGGNMRFLEIVLKTQDLRIEKLVEWAKEKKRFNESADFSDAANEYKQFIEKFLTDVNSIKVGQEYYPIMLFSRPSAKTIEVNVPPNSIKLIGIDKQGDFDFLFKNRVVKFPKFYEDHDDQLPYCMATTIFSEVGEVNQFFTMLNLQFAGRWKLIQKEVK